MLNISNLTRGRPNNVASFNTNSISPVNGSLVLVAVGSRVQGGSGGNVPTLSGLGATWSEITTQSDPGGAQGVRVTIFIGLISGNPTGAITVSFGGQTQTDSTYSIEEITGGDIRNNGQQAIIQNVGANTVSGSSQSISLTSFKSPRNIAYGAFFNGVSGGTSTPEAGFITLSNQNALLTEYETDEQTINYSYVGPNDSAGIALEIGAAKHSAILGAFL